jgi:hypothetical protein
MSGNGQLDDGTILSGTMNLNCNAMLKRWTQIQEQSDKAILGIGDEVLGKNLHIAMGLSSMNDERKKDASVFSDAPWGQQVWKWDKEGQQLIRLFGIQWKPRQTNHWIGTHVVKLHKVFNRHMEHDLIFSSMC